MVLDIILERAFHVLNIKGENPKDLEKVFYIYFYFYFRFLLESKDYVVLYGTVVTGILDMCPGKYDLHFLVGVELRPHAFVNIPDERMHIGVYFIYFHYSFYIHLCTYFEIYLYIFI
jgi:hypothetical protein